ncbi:hypothetical protein DMENIID0001_070110 [Sergentomyia squamirostris]
MPSACTICNLKTYREVDAVLCGACHKIFHAKCLGMCDKELQEYRILTPTRKQAWRCDACTVDMNGGTGGANALGTTGPDADQVNEKISLEEKIDKIASYIVRMENKMATAESVKKILDVVNEMKDRIKNLERDAASLDHESKELTKRVDALEEVAQESPPCDLKTIEIHGLPILRDGDIYAQAGKMLNETLGVNIDDRDLDHCFFVDKSKSRGDLKRGHIDAADKDKSGSRNTGLLVIRFTTRRLRDIVRSRWSQRGRGQEKGTMKVNGQPTKGVRFAERLSLPTRRLLNEARNLAAANNWKFVWTFNGKVLMRKVEKGAVFHIRNLSDLTKVFGE